jgi:hypothetical protein
MGASFGFCALPDSVLELVLRHLPARGALPAQTRLPSLHKLSAQPTWGDDVARPRRQSALCFGAESFTLALALIRLMTMLDLGRNQLDATGASCRRRKPRRPDGMTPFLDSSLPDCFALGREREMATGSFIEKVRRLGSLQIHHHHINALGSRFRFEIGIVS